MAILPRSPGLQSRVVMTISAGALFLIAAPAAGQTAAVWEEIITVAGRGYTDGPAIWDSPGAADLTVSYNQDGVDYVVNAFSSSRSGLVPVAEVQGSAVLSFEDFVSGVSIGCFSSVTYAVQPMPMPGAPAGVNFVPVSVRVRGEATAAITAIAGQHRSAQGLVQQRRDNGAVDYSFQAAAGPDLGVSFDSFDTTYFPSLPTDKETFFFVRASGTATYRFGFEGPLASFHSMADPEITVSGDLIPGTAIPYSDAFEIAYSPNLVPEPTTRLLQLVALVCLAVCRRTTSRATGHIRPKRDRLRLATRGHASGATPGWLWLGGEQGSP